jgi:tetratricopeptide (TPR) repeat protein
MEHNKIESFDSVKANNRLSLPLRKKILFGLLTLIIFFTGSELVLTSIGVKPLTITEDPFVGFAGNLPLFVEQVQPDGTVMYVTAPNKLFAFNHQEFPKIKGPDTYRIFCMGGSTTYGHPYDDATSFCGWLREFLGAAAPYRKWEVINAGGVSYASYRVANLMVELSGYGPDMFIIYSGQNEFLEERTYRNIKNIPSWVSSVKSVLGKTSTYTLLNKAVDSISEKLQAPTEKRRLIKEEIDEILNKTIGPSSYKRNDLLKNQIMDHYKFNLKRMGIIARSAGSEVIFIKPASNIKDISPFKSEHKEGLTETEKKQWLSLYEEGDKFRKSGELTGSLAAFDKASAIDDLYADLHFRRGQVLFRMGRYDEAGESFIRAKDEDVCTLRILTPMSKAVSDISKENNFLLFDFAGFIEDSCYRRYGHKIPGNEYFADHLHPTIETNRRLALSLLDIMIGQGIVRPAASWNKDIIDKITSNIEGRIDKMKQAEALRSLAKLYDWAGKFDEAYNFFSQAYVMFADDEDFLLDFTRSCFRMGRISEAMDYCSKALKINPDNVEAHHNMAEILRKIRKPEEALKHYYAMIGISEKALKVINANKENISEESLIKGNKAAVEDLFYAHENIAQILLLQRKDKEAIYHYNEVLGLKPDSDSAHTNIGIILVRAGRTREAISHFWKALELNPDSSKAHYNLGLTLAAGGKDEEAIRHYSEVLRIEPASVEAHNNLGVILAKQNKLKEAVTHFSKALRIDPDNNEALYNLGSALSLQGKTEEAEFYLSKAKKLKPDHHK